MWVDHANLREHPNEFECAHTHKEKHISIHLGIKIHPTCSKEHITSKQTTIENGYETIQQRLLHSLLKYILTKISDQ